MSLKGINIKMNHIIICAIIVIVMVVVDQVSKVIAFNNLDPNVRYTVIPHIVDYQLVKNRGAMFGIMQGQKTLFIIVTFVGFFIFLFLLKDGDINTMPFYTIGLSLMIAGTIGNFIDRVSLSYVRDFLCFGFWDSFPSFNVADMCMCVGITMFIIDTLFGGAKHIWK